LVVIAGSAFVLIKSRHINIHANARRLQTKSECQMIAVATEFFRTEYGRWPVPVSSPEREVDNGAFMAALRGIDTKANPNAIVFYDGPPRSFQENMHVDHWRHPLHIICDADGDEQIKVGNEVVKRAVVVWSSGPNGKNEDGTRDDIASWR
jgi:hypothetical protein